MNRKIIIWTSALAAIVFLLSAGCSRDPVRWSTNHTRNFILRKVPMGSSVVEVKAFITSQGWKLNYEWQGTNSDSSPRDHPFVNGRHIIGADIGHYQGISFRADVDASWGFDDKGRLISFEVRKHSDKF